MRPGLPIVVFSDVDGLDCARAGSYTTAANTLRHIGLDEVPLVLCSSKTRAEIEEIQQQLGIRHPFVCESGAAALIPAGYFDFEVPNARDRAGYQAVEFGWPYAEVVRTLGRTAGRLGIEIVGFSDMSVDEVARECHLTLLQARLAKLREYGERFRLLDPGETARSRLFRALKAAALHCATGERFDHVGRAVDNGVGVSLLCSLYQRACGGVLTVGLAGPKTEDVLRAASRRVIAFDDQVKGGVDAASWAEAIVNIVETLGRQESSQPAMARDAQR
jgi:predicted mannosyl-3-phosphoglycerate phosphatase (HAD superfamily)